MSRPSRCAARRAALLVAGASPGGVRGDQDELQQWMEQQKREVKPNVEPLSRAEEVHAAAVRGARRGRAVQHTEADASPSSRRRGSRIRLLARRDQPAQGTARGLSAGQHGDGRQRDRNGRPYALLKVDNLLYQVKPGDYLGQNYGKITKISETDVA